MHKITLTLNDQEFRLLQKMVFESMDEFELALLKCQKGIADAERSILEAGRLGMEVEKTLLQKTLEKIHVCDVEARQRLSLIHIIINEFPKAEYIKQNQ